MNEWNSPSPAFRIVNARIVTPEAVLPDAAVEIEEGVIRAVSRSAAGESSRPAVDARGRLLVPGFIDIHSDVIENAIQPRPGGRFPVDVALHELDKQLVACGVTTIYHCLCFLPSDENPLFRTAEMAHFLIGQIHELRGGFQARTRIHARYELTNTEAVDAVEDLIAAGRIDFFSLMDHTPGQGQFREIEHFRAYYAKARGLTENHIARIIARRLEASARLSWSGIERLAAACRARGIRMASHDDDSEAKIEAISRLGVSLSEFPVNREAALAARSRGLMISLGSPNVLRGASLTGNLSAREALRAGLGDILCSDYAPMSLLHAALKVHGEGILDLPSAMRLISLNPARAAGIDGLTGSIEEGKAADLVLVDDRRRVPAVVRTYVGGREVFRAAGPGDPGAKR